MIANAISIVQISIKIKDGIMKHVNVSGKIVVHLKKVITGSTCICENSKYMKSITDTSVIAYCIKKKANTIDCYILHTV